MSNTASILANASAIVALAFLGASMGCTGLSSDCELNLTCPKTTTTTTTSTTTSTTSTTSTTTTTTPPVCKTIYKASCDACIQSSCCQEMADCIADDDCIGYCLNSVWPPLPECSVPATAAALETVTMCMASKCSPSCDPTDSCNPVSNVPCPTDGTACDAAFPGVFVCLPPYGAPVALCGACTNDVGPYCAGGMRCHEASKTCARYCCNDADCGTGKCVTDPMVAFGKPLALMGDVVGICLDQAGITAACDAPMVAPSNGSCVGGYPPP